MIAVDRTEFGGREGGAADNQCQKPLEGAAAPRTSSDMTKTIKLSEARRGDRGVIVRVGEPDLHDDMAIELERRLLELGFVEGARVELLHEGLFGRDPIAMKVDDMTVGLRRREAASILVEVGGASEEIR